MKPPNYDSSEDLWATLNEIDNSEAKRQSTYKKCEQCHREIRIPGYHLKICRDCRKQNVYEFMNDKEIAERREKAKQPSFIEDKKQ
jgi:hypothetical protein